jgi:hypothetical protein
VENLKALGKFIATTMFSGNSSGTGKAKAFFAKAFYPCLTSELYAKCMYPNLPSDKSELGKFEERCRGVLLPFEEEWKQHGIIH